MDKRIVKFIQEHYLLTLATSNENLAYCCSVYYVYNKKENSLIFSSEISTKHVQDFIKNPNVAGSIALETKLVENIQGVQLLGVISELKEEELDAAKKIYVKAFPYAKNLRTHLWEMKLNFIKMTHNQLVFGTKLIWEA
tara:strand:- start:823 stop:1239 length:417 start_codon:yes stop_codon:yes gene_type:complete